MAVRELSVLMEHYKELAPLYDDFQHFHYENLAKLAVRELELKPQDGLVDIGAGTGAITHLCWKIAGLTKPALAVDPSKELLEIASQHEGVATKQDTIENFITSKQMTNYNKFMFCRSFHHVLDQETFLDSLYQKMNPGSKLLIIEQMEDLIWESAKKMCRPVTLNQIEGFLQKAGFGLVKTEEAYIYKYNKEKFFKSLRHRAYSVLKLLSDEDIEKGIAELDRDHFKYKDSMDIQITYHLLRATKYT